MEPEVVTLCGSIRFAAEHLAAHMRLSLEGRVVLLPALPVRGEKLPPVEVQRSGALHRQKIAMSDRVHVVNPGGYVGATTAAEIEYAQALGKDVTYEHRLG
jgi:predicted phosphodiesterase